jgi:hypothetical protein
LARVAASSAFSRISLTAARALSSLSASAASWFFSDWDSDLSAAAANGINAETLPNTATKGGADSASISNARTGMAMAATTAKKTRLPVQ